MIINPTVGLYMDLQYILLLRIPYERWDDHSLHSNFWPWSIGKLSSSGLNVLNGSTAETSLRRVPKIHFAGECHKDHFVYQSYTIYKNLDQMIYRYYSVYSVYGCIFIYLYPTCNVHGATLLVSKSRVPVLPGSPQKLTRSSGYLNYPPQLSKH